MRLIDADELKRDFCTGCIENCKNDCDEIRIINSQPTIDAEPVRRGRWIELAMTGEYKCSVCGRGSRSENTFQLIPKVYWNYCPNCGAKMEE